MATTKSENRPGHPLRLSGVSLVAVLVGLPWASAQTAAEQTYSRALEKIGYDGTFDGEIKSASDYFEYLADRADPEDACNLVELYKRAAIDAYMTEELVKYMGQNLEEVEVFGLPPEEYAAVVDQISNYHKTWLAGEVEEHGWFSDARCGLEAEDAAYLMVQHHSDLDWQLSILEMMEESWRQGSTSYSNIAFLKDRVRIKQERPQIYGTQGYCVEGGRWQPFELENRDKVDELRAEAGLPSLDEYAATVAGNFCQKDTVQ